MIRVFILVLALALPMQHRSAVAGEVGSTTIDTVACDTPESTRLIVDAYVQSGADAAGEVADKLIADELCSTYSFTTLGSVDCKDASYVISRGAITACVLYHEFLSTLTIDTVTTIVIVYTHLLIIEGIDEEPQTVEVPTHESKIKGRAENTARPFYCSSRKGKGLYCIHAEIRKRRTIYLLRPILRGRQSPRICRISRDNMQTRLHEPIPCLICAIFFCDASKKFLSHFPFWIFENHKL